MKKKIIIRIIGLMCGRTVSYKFRDPGETNRHIKRTSLFYRETSTKKKIKNAACIHLMKSVIIDRDSK